MSPILLFSLFYFGISMPIRKTEDEWVVPHVDGEECLLKTKYTSKNLESFATDRSKMQADSCSGQFYR